MKRKKKEEEQSGFLSDFYYNHKILIWIFIFIILFILIIKYVVGDRKPVTPVNEDIVLTLEPSSGVTVGKGNTVNLRANVNVSDAIIIWSSSNTSVATVNSGNVTGVNYGKTTITALYIDKEGNKYSKTCEVSVIEGNPSVTLQSISFPEGDLYMPVNKEYQLNLMLNPSNSMVSEKQFVSSNSTVASVTQDGVVKSHKAGYTRIIATINNNYQTAIDVYVNKSYSKSEIVISPSLITFDNDTRKIKVGTSEKLNYTVTPSNVDRSKLTWSSNDSSIVSVDSNGTIVGRKEGETIVTVQGVNGERADIIVEVYNEIIPVKEIIVSTTVINMEAGSTKVIQPTITPSNASNQGLNYSSMDPSIVSVGVNGAGSTAILSALKKGSTTIVISSGNIERRITVNVTGENNNSQIDEDDNNLPTTIKVRSDKNNLAKTYDEAKKIPVPSETKVSISLSVGVGKIKYCYTKYGSSCTPNIEKYADTTIIIPSGAMYVLRIIKYDYNDKEISSSSVNYTNGSLYYYINTESEEEAKHYTVTGAYDTITMARTKPGKIGDKVVVKVDDSTRHLSVCSATDTTCTPTIRVSKSYTFDITKAGTTRIYISEFDHATYNKIGETAIYYVYVKPDTNTNTGIDNNSTVNNNTQTSTEETAGTSKVKASGLSVYHESSIGKYLSVNVESDLAFTITRFCYKVVNKDANGTCNLDLTSSSVPFHNGQSYYHPILENKTYYATLASTKSKVLLFDIDGLDQLYDNNDTNKDVIFEFAINSSKGYSYPIKVRINMTSKSGTTSYWKSSFIK